MINDITVFNIRDYLSVKDDQELGEEALKELLSEFSCIKNVDVEKFLKEQSVEFTSMVVFLEAENEEKLIKFYEEKNGFKRFDIKEIKLGADDAHTLIQFLKVL